MSIKCIKDVTEYNYSIFEIKGGLTGFLLGSIVFMGCSLTCVNAS